MGSLLSKLVSVAEYVRVVVTDPLGTVYEVAVRRLADLAKDAQSLTLSAARLLALVAFAKHT